MRWRVSFHRKPAGIDQAVIIGLYIGRWNGTFVTEDLPRKCYIVQARRAVG